MNNLRAPCLNCLTNNGTNNKGDRAAILGWKRGNALTYLLDILGTLVFAVSGAFRAVKYELDLLGVLVLAVATGVGGGILRDLLIGFVPPSAFRDETYLLVCFLGGLLVFLAAPKIARRWDLVMAADALGLGVFSAIGAAKAAEFHLGPVGIVMMAVLTATGGGVVRDILVREIPAVIRVDFYATAALCGGLSFLAAGLAGMNEFFQLLISIIVATGLRLIAMIYRINLPRVRSLPESPTELTHRHKAEKKKPRAF